MSTATRRDQRPVPADPQALGFLRWQCRARQMLMREHDGRPDASVMPVLSITGSQGSEESIGHLMTVLNRLPEHSMLPELQHISRRSFEPAKRREDALKLFCSTYFQRAQHFSDMLTASFGPESEAALRIQRARHATLRFDKFSQKVELRCRVWRLTERNYFWQATFWHNGLFNPGAPADMIVLGFEPEWEYCKSEPPFHA